jgi:predicted RNA-binding protein YlxR (DUF448 family)
VPQRRCVGCGRIAPKSELLRIAVDDTRSSGDDVRAERRAVLDRAGTMPGRGAYLCRDGAGEAGSQLVRGTCLQGAVRRRAIARALRCAVTLDPEIVESPGGRRSRAQAPKGRVPLFSSEPMTNTQ